MFGELSFGKLLLILIIVLVVFGAKRLPDIARSLGQSIREFKRSLDEKDSSKDDRPADGGTGK